MYEDSVGIQHYLPDWIHYRYRGGHFRYFNWLEYTMTTKIIKKPTTNITDLDDNIIDGVNLNDDFCASYGRKMTGTYDFDERHPVSSIRG